MFLDAAYVCDIYKHNKHVKQEKLGLPMTNVFCMCEGCLFKSYVIAKKDSYFVKKPVPTL